MKTVLVCELADAPLTIEGTVFTYACAECGRSLMVAPSGQRWIREQAEPHLICKYCLVANGHAPQRFELAATVEEIAQECVSARPNLRRQRN